MSDCGMTWMGICQYAGSEYCDWDCPADRDEDEDDFTGPAAQSQPPAPQHGIEPPISSSRSEKEGAEGRDVEE